MQFLSLATRISLRVCFASDIFLNIYLLLGNILIQKQTSFFFSAASRQTQKSTNQTRAFNWNRTSKLFFSQLVENLSKKKILKWELLIKSLRNVTSTNFSSKSFSLSVKSSQTLHSEIALSRGGPQFWKK